MRTAEPISEPLNGQGAIDQGDPWRDYRAWLKSREAGLVQFSWARGQGLLLETPEQNINRAKGVDNGANE